MVTDSPLALLYPTLIASLTSANYTILPNEEGVPHLIKLDYTPLTAAELNTLSGNLNSITFTLFTRNNPLVGQALVPNNITSVRGSDWNANRPTIIVTHGWNSAGTKPACTLVRDAFLRALDSNVIVTDWSAIANSILYSSVAKSVPAVADHVASLVNFLRAQAALNPSDLKLIGHSLGAHVVSLSARIVSRSSQVAEVIALDPAMPMFQGKGPDDRVDRSHARHVQVIHTSAGSFGMSDTVGTSDFLANGGKSQPGCSSSVISGCSHGRSYEYYSESVTNPRGFPGVAEKGGARAYMGGPYLDPNAEGTYSFKTSNQPPYAIGG